METTEQADSGYPEEAPPEVVPDDTGSKGGSAADESARPDKAADDAPETDDGTAMGGSD